MVSFGLTLIRHGETQYNKDRLIQGQTDIPLSSVGKQQVLLLGSRLKKETFSHVYSSDLSRASETAKYILEMNQECAPSIVKDVRLRERKFGVMEGKPIKFLKDVANKSCLKIKAYNPLGAESLQQVHRRAISFFQELCLILQKENTICCKNLKDYSADVDEKNNSHLTEIACPNELTMKQDLNTADINMSNLKTKSTDDTFSPVERSNEKTYKIFHPNIIANVLVVTHGGFINELIRYIVQDLKCSMPGGKKTAFKSSPNASLSKFIITVNNHMTPNITCIYIHDKQHLNNNTACNNEAF